jgi:hypothetical protein
MQYKTTNFICMKKYVYLFTILFFAFVACKEESKEIFSKAPDGRATIHITGTRASSLGGWTVNIMGRMGDSTEAGVTTEIFVSALDSPYLRITWANNLRSIVAFKERDDKIRIFEGLFDEGDNFNIREVRNDNINP